MPNILGLETKLFTTVSSQVQDLIMKGHEIRQSGMDWMDDSCPRTLIYYMVGVGDISSITTLQQYSSTIAGTYYCTDQKTFQKYKTYLDMPDFDDFVAVLPGNEEQNPNLLFQHLL